MKYNTEKNIAYVKAHVPKDRLEQYENSIRADERNKTLNRIINWVALPKSAKKLIEEMR